MANMQINDTMEQPDESDPRYSAYDDDIEATKDPSLIKHLISEYFLDPTDIYMIIFEHLNVIDWDAKSASIAEPLGRALVASFYCIRLLQDNLLRPNYSRIYTSVDAFDLRKSSKLQEYPYLMKYAQSTDKTLNSSSGRYLQSLGYMDKTFHFLIVALIVLNVYITWLFLWGNFVTYSLFYLKHRPDSKSVVKRSLNDLNQDLLNNVNNGSIWTMLKYYFFNVVTEKNDIMDPTGNSSSNSEGEKNYFYQLNKWVPSKFLQTIFCSFSPTVTVFLLMSDITFYTLIPIVIHNYLMNFIVFDRYENRISDDNIINSAAAGEFDQKYVKRMLSKELQDAKVDATDFNSDYVTEFFPSKTSGKDRTFTTHSLDGSTVVEIFNEEKKQFDKLSDNKNKVHNTVRISKRIF